MSCSPALRHGPNFFVIGAQKAGTTRLCELLNRHPEVAIPTKEPFYFQSTTDMSAKQAWYEELFARVASVPARGDGSTPYSMCARYPGTAQRIAAHDPAAKLVYLVRHPIRRIESAWSQLLSVGDASSFYGFRRTLVDTELLLDPSRYWTQLSAYRRYFPDEQIHLAFFEEFVKDEGSIVRGCLEFLGVDASVPLQTDDHEGRNASDEKRQRLPLVDAVRALPGYERVKRHIPQPLKTLFTDHINQRVPPVVWEEDLLAWACDRLGAEMSAFLSFAGRPAGYWSIR